MNGVYDGQFNSPQHLAVDDAGNIYVADYFGGRIQKFDSSGNLLFKWGGNGSGDGQLHYPVGLTVDGAGNLFVTENVNDRIQKYALDFFVLDDASPDDSDIFTNTITFGDITAGIYHFSENEVDGWGLASINCSGGSTVADLTSRSASVTISPGDDVICTFSNTAGLSNTISIKKESTPAEGTDFIFQTDVIPALSFAQKWGDNGSSDGQFNAPAGTAVDSAGNVYVVDRQNHRVQKFDRDGTFVAKWGSQGGGDGQFDLPTGVALDSNGDVFVTDANNHRIQKFTNDGAFLGSWGGFGSGAGRFRFPADVAIDDDDHIYVADWGNHRVQKFGSGAFISEWGSNGSGDGQFTNPRGIEVDGAGNVLVTDSGNDRIQKFNSGGVFLAKWGDSGSADGQFNNPGGLMVDGAGDIFVADSGNDRIQKFDSSGGFLGKWGGSGSGDGQFANPRSIAGSRSGNIYITDAGNDRIQKFTADLFTLDNALPDDNDLITDTIAFSNVPLGTYEIREILPPNWFLDDIICSGGGSAEKLSSQRAILTLTNGSDLDCTVHNARASSITLVKKAAPSDGLDFTYQTDLRSLITYDSKWGSQGGANSQFDGLIGVAADRFGNVFVADTNNHRIQKFDSSGAFLGVWGSFGSSDGRFNTPTAVAVDVDGNVYVSDAGNHRVQKFDGNGAFLTKWGSFGSGDGQFDGPEGLTVDSVGDVYVADTNNNRIQKFDSSGAFLNKWGSSGHGNGQFNYLRDVAVDKNGFVYVADTNNNRIQKFDSSGVFLNKWGSFGTGNGQFNSPRALTVDSTGSVYVSEWGNSRLQKFDSSGVFLAKLGSLGVLDGQFLRPHGVTIDSTGSIFVADTSNHRIQKLITDFFTLDDAVPDDGDMVTDTISFGGLSPGTFSFTETLPADWVLTGISCSGGSAITNLPNRRTAVTIGGGEDVICTFDNRAIITHTVQLNTGWNMISTYLSPDPATMASILSQDDGLLCKDDEGNVYWPEFDIYQIVNWGAAKGYQCFTSSQRDIAIGGTMIPVGELLSLPQGWSMVAYWRDIPLTAEAALAACAAELVLAKNGVGDVYWPAFNVNQIGEMYPEQGYQMYLDNNCDLNYPSGD